LDASEALPREGAHALFSAGPQRDPTDPGSFCRFLAREAADGSIEPTTGVVDSANRCVAIGDPVPQSGQQQELVCLASAHVNCPRYRRGLLVVDSPAAAPRREPTSPAVIGAALVLAAALAASFGFLAVRGGFTVPLASQSPAPVAVAIGPSAGLAASPTVATPPSTSPSPSPTPSPTPSAAPTPTPPPAATPTPRPTTTPAPSSDRFEVLTRCPSQSDCWIYVIRSGDNLTSIANWFGVSFDRMMAMNPNLALPIRPGDRLRIPTPTN
jgi:hypothetical protein